MAKTKYYFAYGSNMNMKYLKTWLVQHGSRPDGIGSARKATLKGYKLVTNQFSQMWKCGNVNLIEDKKGQVEGVLMEIDNAIENLLIKKESTFNGYEKLYVTVHDDEKKEFEKVLLFHAPKADKKDSHPVSKQYLDTIVAGATEFELSPDYIETLKKLPVAEK